MMTEIKLLQQLRDQTYVMLKNSPLHGIGVFAISSIFKGCRDIFSKDKSKWIKLPIKEVEMLPEHSRSLIETYCLFDEENYFVPETGFKTIDPVVYLNHSSSPNILSINDGEVFEALVDISPGQELLVNYTLLADGLESYNNPPVTKSF